MIARLRAWLRTKMAQFALLGGLVGLIFPIGATVLETIYHGEPLRLGAMIQIHRSHAIFWFIDTTPIVLGFLAALAGRRDDRLIMLAEKLEQQVEKRVSEVLRRNQFYETLVSVIPLPIVSIDEYQQIVTINPAFEQLFGYSQDEVTTKQLDPLITDEGTLEFARELTSIARQGQSFHRTGTRVKKDGTRIEVEIRGAPVILDGEQVGALGIYEDVTARKQAEQALSDSEARYRSLFQNSPISLWEEDHSKIKEFIDDLKAIGVTNLRAYFERNPDIPKRCASLVEIIDVNDASLGLYEAASKSELREGLERVLTKEGLKVFADQVIALAENQLVWEADVPETTITGKPIQVHVRMQVAPGYEETWGKVFVSVLDITKQKHLEQRAQETFRQMETLARTDPLTGLYNRRAFTEHAMAELERSSREQTSLAIALLDLDGLKAINDEYGHAAGDAALRQTAETMRKSIRIYDRIGRWGGDEFIMILPQVQLDEAEDICARLRKKLNEQRVSIGKGGELPLEVSIGVTATLGNTPSKATFDELLQQADEALYRAKDLGRNQVCAYESPQGQLP